MVREKYEENAEEFLKICGEFQLGNLLTESPHSQTFNLSTDAKQNIEKAIETIKGIDLDVFFKIKKMLPEIYFLKEEILKTIRSGGRIFLCGCGATGRLSLALETIWRHQHINDENLKEKIVGFMAGGDVALIHSIEKFEDFPEFGERQLRELEFGENDLFIGITEGGETPFVIGATEGALKISKRDPFFLYCNPDDLLIQTAKRSAKIIKNSKIHKINLTVGPMALTGSTRMQATTILMYGVGLALCFFDKKNDLIEKEIDLIINLINKNDFNFLKPFIEKEYETYLKKEYLFYETDSYLGISILTDTTERAPTFSLFPFENQKDAVKNPSLSYLYFKNSKNAEAAWNDLLQRSPRTFHWKEITSATSFERLKGFDFSENFPKIRKAYLANEHRHFKIYFKLEKNALSFQLEDLFYVLELGAINFLSTHLILKILMNNLSTVLMGKMGRYESNLMTWVRASNNKLVDRAVRYAGLLLAKKGIHVPYEKLVHACFKLKEETSEDSALVLRIVEEFS